MLNLARRSPVLTWLRRLYMVGLFYRSCWLFFCGHYWHSLELADEFGEELARPLKALNLRRRRLLMRQMRES